MDVYWIPVAAIMGGCFVLIGVSAIIADAWNKEQARKHEEKMKRLELEQLKMDRTSGEK